MSTLPKTSKKMFSKDGQINDKMTQNGVIGPFHYLKLSLSSLCEIVGAKSRMCYDFLFYIPGYCLTFENEQVKKRWVWNWNTYYSSNSDLVAFLIHSSTFIPNKTATNPLGLLVTVRFIDAKPPSYSMRRKNGIRSRYSSKLKGSCFFAKSIEIINDQGKEPTDYWTVPQLREFINLNCKTVNGSRNLHRNPNMGYFEGSIDTRDLVNDQRQKRKTLQNSKFIHQSKHFRITVGKNQEREEELELELEQEQQQEQELQQQQQQQQQRKQQQQQVQRQQEREKKNIYKNRDQKNRFKKKSKKIYNHNTTQNYNDHILQNETIQNNTLNNSKILNRKRKHKAFVRLPTIESQSSSNSSSNSDYENISNSSYLSSQSTNTSLTSLSYTNSNPISNSKSESEFHLQMGKKKKKKMQNFTGQKKTKKRKGRRRKAKIKRKVKQTKNKKIKANKPQMISSVSLPNLIFLQQNGNDLFNEKEKLKNISKNNKLSDDDDDDEDEDEDQFYNSEPEMQDGNLDTQNSFDSFLKNSKSFMKKKIASTTNPNQQQLDHFRRKKSILLSIWEKCGSKQFLQTDFHSNNERALDMNLLSSLSISNKKNSKNTNYHENSFSSQTVLYSLSNEPCLSYSLDYIGDFGFQNKDQTYYKFRSQVLYLETAEKRFELSFEQNGLFRFAQVLNPETYHYNSILNPINTPMENNRITVIKQNLFWGQIKWSNNCILFGDFMLEPIKFFWCKKKKTTELNNNNEN
ncbi:kinesin-like protein klp98a [Anaeramoeba flamelloides]|uniref:Kinesin-like protein klp98a n=1 Tax=Anaeramoeba flamelloides TaxID=1746091 RepID=A0AAV8A1D2_9EUKA|nr:kinesin-like protein klp98a [Anaeramoeba flamelloides]